MRPASTILTGIIALGLLAIAVLDIPVVRYIAVAVVGICVILINRQHSDTETGRASSKKLADTSERPSVENHELCRLFELLESAVKEDLVVIKQELLQIKGLVNNAASELTESFYKISSNSDEQYRLIKQTVESSPNDIKEKVLSTLDNTSKNIKDNSANAIRSLQFEDIVIQVSDNSLQYIENLDKFLNEFRQKLIERINAETTSNNDDTKGLLKSCVTDVEQIRQLVQLPDRKAVHQNNLSEGGVELF